MQVMPVSKYEEVSRLNNGSAMASFLGRCMHGVVSPLGGKSTKWKLVFRYVGKDPKKYVTLTWFCDTQADAEEKQRSVPEGTVKKISKTTLDTKSEIKYISATVKQNVLLNGKGVTTLLMDVPVVDKKKAEEEMATFIEPAMDLQKIATEQGKTSYSQKEAFIDFVAVVRKRLEERSTDKGQVADFELIDVSGKAGSRVCHLVCSSWHEHATILQNNVGKACLFLHMKLSNGSSKLETSHGSCITLLHDSHPAKAALNEAYAAYQEQLPEDAVQVNQAWQPGGDNAVDTSGRQPLFCAAALRAHMAQTNPDIDGKKV